MIVSELVAKLGFATDMTGARQFDAALNNMARSAESSAARIRDVFQIAALSITAAFAGLALVARPIAKAGDEMTMAIAKIESALGRSATSAAEATGIYDTLYEVGQRTGIAANDSAAGFTKFQLAMDDLGRPAADTIKLLEGIQSAGVIAGASTGDVSEAIRQLGQALGKGKLNGDELVSLSERMPRLVRDVQKELSMTTAEFFEAAEKGKLTPQLLVPALMAASRKSIEELANFPLTMGRAYAKLRNSANRFLAELDKQLNLSQTIARVFDYIATTLDGWRSGLSVVGDLVRLLGGLEGIARLVGVSLLVAFGPAVLGAVRGLGAAVWFLARGIVTALLPLAGFAAWVLIVEDFIGWMQGKSSLFGDKFGNFDDVIKPIKDKLEEFKAWFATIPAGISEAWTNGVAGMKPQVDWLIGVVKMIMDAFQPLVAFFDGVLEAIIGRFVRFYEKVVGVINGIKSLLPGMEGTGTGTDDGAQGEQRRRFGSRGALGGFPGIDDPDTIRGLGMSLPNVEGRVGAGPVSNSQTNSIPIEITINAPGSDATSIGNAAQAGVQRATDYMTPRLGNSFALGLGMASPRVEGASQ